MNPIVGSIVALVTPMLDDGSVDYPTLRRLIDWHIAEGTACIGVVGTTGESPTVSIEENCEIIRVAVEHAAGRVPIMAGAGANSTAEALEMTRFAKKVGANCTLQVVPYYNKPTQEGIYRHFRAIAEGVDLPVILYNVPGRTVADMANDTVMRLTQVPGIVGIKDATGNVDRGAWLIKQAPQGFSNVAPRAMAELCRAAIAGNARQAREIHFKLLALHRQLFAEANPIPVKWALARLGRCGPALRLPLVGLSEALHAPLEQALREAGLL
jgi:4-hydroxy-tetrahydrodipicolinate synthase